MIYDSRFTNFCIMTDHPAKPDQALPYLLLSTDHLLLFYCFLLRVLPVASFLLTRLDACLVWRVNFGNFTPVEIFFRNCFPDIPI